MYLCVYARVSTNKRECIHEISLLLLNNLVHLSCGDIKGIWSFSLLGLPLSILIGLPEGKYR